MLVLGCNIPAAAYSMQGEFLWDQDRGHRPALCPLTRGKSRASLRNYRETSKLKSVLKKRNTTAYG